MRKREKVNGRRYTTPEEVNFEWIPPLGLAVSILVLVGYIIVNFL